MSRHTMSLKSGLLFILLTFLLIETATGQVQSTRAGSWIEATTWAGGVVPGNNDTVLKDVVVKNDSVVIPYGSTIEINNLTIGGGGKLVVNGRLIVHQNVLMTNTSVGYSMGPSAAVIIYGNFEIKNQVTISLSSFLVIYGDFIKSGSSTQGDVAIDEGNIYVLGEVSGNGWPNDFGCTSGDYSGTTPNESQDCDYGNQQDYEDNQETFPDDLVDLINCYDLSSISATGVCPGGTASLSITNPQLVNVVFEWQVNISNTWTVIGNTRSVTVSNIQDFDREYRLIVRRISATSTCKISISRNIKIPLTQGSIWTGTVDADWNNPGNWSCNSLPTLTTDVNIPSGLSNYPVVNAGANALAKDLTIETGAKVIVTNNWLRIAGQLVNSGILNADNGSVSFEGTSAQTIPSGAFTGNRIKNLRVDNAAGVTSLATIWIINSLEVAAGTFATGNNLTLISNPTGTAYIDGSGGGQVTGTVKLQRFLSNAFGYKYFSSPFQNSIVADLAANFDLEDTQTGFPHLYEYVENRKDGEENDLTGWQKYLDVTASLKPGWGYAINPSGTSGPLTLEISGTVNNGPIALSLENNNGTYTNGFNLVGNPYPSPIDWNLMLPTLTGIDNAIYFFNAGSDDRYTGTYSSYVNGVSTGMNTTIVPSMQGFFVRVSDPADGVYPAIATLNFTNAARTGNEISQKYYQAKNKTEVPLIRLSARFKGEEASDATVIYFRNGATADFEKDLDAQKIFNTAIEVPSFYSLSSRREKLAINAISGQSVETNEIPLGINAKRSGEVVLRLEETLHLFPMLHIYLRDKEKNVLTALDKRSDYSFNIQKGENNHRFVLLFSSEQLTAAEMAEATEDFAVHNRDKEIVVELNLSDGQNGKISLSNLTGQVLQRKTGAGKEEIRFSGSLPSGIYLVTLETEKESRTKKIILKSN